MSVLAPVDVDLAAPRAQRPRDRRDLRLFLDADRGEQPREGPRHLVVVARAERKDDVEAGRAGGLDVAPQLQLVEDAMESMRNLDDVGERRALGIQVEHEPVGPIERGQVRAPEMERDRS